MPRAPDCASDWPAILLTSSSVEIDDVHQLGPRPGQAGAELGKEVAHAGFTASDAIVSNMPICAQRMPKE
jgi:hypothetical protein